MFGMCNHEWHETTRKTFPSTGVRIASPGYFDEDTKKSLFGYTVIEYQCAKCGKHRREDFIGEM